MLLTIRKIGSNKPSQTSCEGRTLPPCAAVVGRETQLQAPGAADPQAVIGRNVQSAQRSSPKLAGRVFRIIVCIEFPKVAVAEIIAEDQAGRAATVGNDVGRDLLLQTLQLASGTIEGVEIAVGKKGCDLFRVVAV